jgi:hypothetical protein
VNKREIFDAYTQEARRHLMMFWAVHKALMRTLEKHT